MPDNSEQWEVVQLAEQARDGDKGALDRLAGLAARRLRPYIYRLTLQEDLAEEILQETLLEMVMILGKLKNSDRFWPWLYGIALNKLRRHYRSEQAFHKAWTPRTSSEPLTERQEGLENLVAQEIKQVVINAMKALKARYRAVLVMRCYDGMSYAEIAQALGCTEFGSRMLFLRAKKALEKKLAENGLKKGSLLGALILFGKLTAPSEAAAAQIAVSAATLEVGLAASLAGLATSKVAVTAAAAGIVGFGAVMGPRLFEARPAERPAEQTIERLYVGGLFGHHPGKGQRYWYFMPEGPGGPVLLRAQADGGPVVLQNAVANYLYDGGMLYINNYRHWAPDLSVIRLPTDPPAMTDFLARLEGRATVLPYTKSSAKGLLVEVGYDAQNGFSRPEVVVNPNVSDEDYFQYDWPLDVPRKDNRDLMHRRGWTFFTITGQIRGQQVSGRGRIPLYYQNYLRSRPWLELSTGKTRIIDPTQGPAVVLRQADAGQWQRRLYPAGGFFKGLSRPWAGLHTIDLIRRDAAERQLWFTTRQADRAGQMSVQVDLTDTLKAVFTIDMEADLVERIDLLEEGRSVGTLVLEYAQQISTELDSLTEPAVPPTGGAWGQGLGILWLARLAEDALL